MKYNYLCGRSVMPNGNKSTTLACFECGKPQSWSYCTKDQKHICSSCKCKDEKGLLEANES